jgi:hypothetical protein
MKNGMSAMLHHVALVRTDVSEELTGATWRNIPEDAILHVCEMIINFLNLHPGQPRTLLQLKLVGILTVKLFLT